MTTIPTIPDWTKLIQTESAPDWLISAVLTVLNNKSPETIGGISCDSKGNLIYYKKLGKHDITRIIENVDEVWITVDFPSEQ